VFIVIIRDVALLAGAVSYVSSTRRFDIKPSLISKFNTFIQILLVLAVIFGQVNDFPAVIIQILIGLTLCTTIASGYDYFIAERSRRASNKSSKQA
jgi:cardiolipin synthase